MVNLRSGPGGVKGARVLMTKNLKLPRKRPGAPKCVRRFTKLITEFACEEGTREAYSEVEALIWNALFKCDERGKRYFKEEDMTMREKENAKRNKEKNKAKKKAAKERRATRKKSGKQKRRGDDSSDLEDNSTSSASSLT
uniref:Uncharacterized protein n=1 Tax=Eutreptiella gymnastica TaxID=73025 RepID=A0A7S4FKE7_9EUGL